MFPQQNQTFVLVATCYQRNCNVQPFLVRIDILKNTTHTCFLSCKSFCMPGGSGSQPISPRWFTIMLLNHHQAWLEVVVSLGSRTMLHHSASSYQSNGWFNATGQVVPGCPVHLETTQIVCPSNCACPLRVPGNCWLANHELRTTIDVPTNHLTKGTTEFTTCPMKLLAGTLW